MLTIRCCCRFPYYYTFKTLFIIFLILPFVPFLRHLSDLDRRRPSPRPSSLEPRANPLVLAAPPAAPRSSTTRSSSP